MKVDLLVECKCGFEMQCNGVFYLSDCIYYDFECLQCGSLICLKRYPDNHFEIEEIEV